ncbi:8058_t:CDS:1, partial [Gigaspora rosea]
MSISNVKRGMKNKDNERGRILKKHKISAPVKRSVEKLDAEIDRRKGSEYYQKLTK